MERQNCFSARRGLFVSSINDTLGTLTSGRHAYAHASMHRIVCKRSLVCCGRLWLLCVGGWLLIGTWIFCPRAPREKTCPPEQVAGLPSSFPPTFHAGRHRKNAFRAAEFKFSGLRSEQSFFLRASLWTLSFVLFESLVASSVPASCIAPQERLFFTEHLSTFIRFI